MIAPSSFAVQAFALSSIIASVVNAALPEAVLVVRSVELYKRETNDTVGTNLYNCHDNCGEAILEEEVAGFCNSTIFQTDYAACLQCSGPDNENIWEYYGPYLTAGAVECGSATVPLNGTQADVATALPAQNASSTSVGAGATTSSNAGGSTAASTTAAAKSSGTASAAASATSAVS